MGRSVVLAGAARCPTCSLPPRWCTCDIFPAVGTRLAVHVLIHRGEQGKPSSTGKLVARAVAGAAPHLYQRKTKFCAASSLPAAAIEPHGELLILHPSGAPLPVSPSATAVTPPARRQVLLLDGTWRQAGEMLRAVEGMGRCVRLPDAAAEPSRYWLRDQPARGQLSTAEALLGVFHCLGEHDAAARLRLHFELHVYATLLARGRREMAERYLGHSPLLTEAPDALNRLHHRGPGSPSPPDAGPT